MGAAARKPTEDTVQMNVRVPVSLVAAIDARRAEIRQRTGRRVSRDRWVTKAAEYALQQHPPNPPGPRPAR